MRRGGSSDGKLHGLDQVKIGARYAHDGVSAKVGCQSFNDTFADLGITQAINRTRRQGCLSCQGG
jgi:hypothetical protein